MATKKQAAAKKEETSRRYIAADAYLDDGFTYSSEALAESPDFDDGDIVYEIAIVRKLRVKHTQTVEEIED